jgi:predicted ATP-grasp superfamily ATP-dependent carboligase
MSLVVAHSLSRHGVEVIGGDDVELTVLSFSRYVRRTFVHAPLRGDPEAFLLDLEEKVRRFKPEDGRPYVLMPVFRETDLIAEHRERFEPYVSVAVPPFDAIDQVHPKDRLAGTVRRLGLEAPLTVHPQSEADLDRAISLLSFPVILKPTNDMGGRGVVICKNAKELLDAYRSSKRSRGEAGVYEKERSRRAASVEPLRIVVFPVAGPICGGGLTAETLKSDFSYTPWPGATTA